MRAHAGDPVHRARGDLAPILNLVVRNAGRLAGADHVSEERPVLDRRGLQGPVVSHLHSRAIGQVEEVRFTGDEVRVVLRKSQQSVEGVRSGPLDCFSSLGCHDGQSGARDRSEKSRTASEVRIRRLMAHAQFGGELAHAELLGGHGLQAHKGRIDESRFEAPRLPVRPVRRLIDTT